MSYDIIDNLATLNDVITPNDIEIRQHKFNSGSIFKILDESLVQNVQ